MAATFPALRNIGLATVIGLALPACLRHEVMVTGSIKDDPPPAASQAKPAPKKVAQADDKPQKSKEASVAKPAPAPDKAAEAKPAAPRPGAADAAAKDAGAKMAASAATSPAPVPVVQSAPAAKATTSPAPSAAQPVVNQAPAAAASGSAAAPAPAPKAQPAPAAAVVAMAPKAPAPAAAAPSDEKSQAARLVAEGKKLFETGKVQEARRRFVAALSSQSPEATHALAQSYDSYFISKLSSSDATPDIGRALQLYTTAVERGSKEAEPDLARLRVSLGLSPK